MAIWNIRQYIYDIAANFLDSCRFYYKKKQTQKTKVKDVGAGVGGVDFCHWVVLQECFFKNLCHDLIYNGLEYF